MFRPFCRDGQKGLPDQPPSLGRDKSSRPSEGAGQNWEIPGGGKKEEQGQPASGERRGKQWPGQQQEEFRADQFAPLNDGAGRQDRTQFKGFALICYSSLNLRENCPVFAPLSDCLN